jgi:hypothetical protein
VLKKGMKSIKGNGLKIKDKRSEKQKEKGDI